MKNRFKILSLAILAFNCSCSYLEIAENSHSGITGIGIEDSMIGIEKQEIPYYYFDERLTVSERRDLIFLQFEDNASLRQFQNFIVNGVSAVAQYGSSGANQPDECAFMVVRSDDSMLLRKFVADLNTIDEGVLSASYLVEYQGETVAVTRDFAVKLKNRDLLDEFMDLVSKCNCEVYQKEEFASDVYFVRTDGSLNCGAIRLAGEFYETGLFEYTSPDFFVFGGKNSADEYIGNQWGLFDTGQYGAPGYNINVSPVWERTRGSGVVVAVLDDGVELAHPDLVQNIVPGYDAVLSTDGGGAVLDGDTHGTPVAGIIAAVKDNGIGITGVAPECKIMPVRVYAGTYSSSAIKASGINWAWQHGADVINCSWSDGLPDALLTSAIGDATKHGRDGRGCVVVFAAGNKPNGDNEQVKYPASLYNVMAVGAMSHNGKRKNLSTPDGEPWSSNYGSTLDIVAPGVRISTTDRLGTCGLNSEGLSGKVPFDLPDHSYTFWLNGTSSAAPFVSGVAALILSVYPDLTQSLVRRSIELGGRKLEGYRYVDDGQYPSGSRNDEVGYGLVDANRSMLEARRANESLILDNTSGIDFVIMNGSSYELNDVIIDIQGTIDGSQCFLVSSDIMGPIESQHQAGYPEYRGRTINAASGSVISDMSLNLFATCADFSGDLSIGWAFDSYTKVNSFEKFSFGLGESFYVPLPDMVVPDARRRILYIRIFD